MMNVCLSIINDEISSDLEECISFCRKHNVVWIELRSFNNTSVFNLSDQTLEHVASRFRESGLQVSCIASPLYKWDLEEKVISHQFGFNKVKTEEYYIDRSLYIAQLFKCERVRVFSFLDSETFRFQTLVQRLAPLLEKANKAGISILMENEPICNIKFIKQLGGISAFDSGNISPLVDLGNEFSIGNSVIGRDEWKVIESSHYFHIKDYDVTGKRYVVLGQGDIPYQEVFAQLLKANPKHPIFLSLETHTGNVQDTLDSFIYLRTLCR